MWVTKKRTITLLLLLLVSPLLAAASNTDLEARIVKLERQLDSRGLLELLQNMERLQQDMQQLRGDVELQTHQFESLQKRQRDLYLDIDRRLHRLEAGGVQTQPAQHADATEKGDLVSPAGQASTPSGSATGVVLNPAEERKDYDNALNILKDGRYDEASVAFRGFLDKHAGSSYADNAQYWLGEVYYVTRQYKKALVEFGKILNDYPDSSKAADASLKTGYIQYEFKEWAAARKALTGVIQKWPGTSAARLARQRLDRMQKEGH